MISIHNLGSFCCIMLFHIQILSLLWSSYVITFYCIVFYCYSFVCYKLPLVEGSS